MKLNILEVIIFLYQLYLDNNEPRLHDLEEWIAINSNTLKKFPVKAAVEKHSISEDYDLSSSTRVYSIDETQKLDAVCIGYLMRLEQDGIISPTVREKIIQGALAFNRTLEPRDIQSVVQDIITEELENDFELTRNHKIFTENPNILLH